MSFYLIKDTEVAELAGVEVNGQLERVTNSVVSEFLRGTGRTFERRERTVVFPGWNTDYIFLSEAPIDSIAEVRIDCTGEFDDDTIISDLSLFSFETDDAKRELDFRIFYRGGYFPEAPRAVRVKFTAGYYPPDDNTAGNVRLPDDIRDELIHFPLHTSMGSWRDPSSYGDEYATAMALLILQTPNNYLPIFQR